jgi:hypothetical protein
MRSLQALAKVFHNIVFNIPYRNHPVEAKPASAQLGGDILRVSIRYVSEQNFIPDCEQGSGHMGRLIGHSSNSLPVSI